MQLTKSRGGLLQFIAQITIPPWTGWNSESGLGQHLSIPSISKLGPSELYLNKPDRRLGGASEAELLLMVGLAIPN